VSLRAPPAVNIGSAVVEGWVNQYKVATERKVGQCDLDENRRVSAVREQNENGIE
jgi:hypothetical protein